MIQYLSISIRDTEIRGIDFNTISKPKSLDGYDLNIIDFNDTDLWLYSQGSLISVNCMQDLTNLKTMILNCKKTKFLVLYPRNLEILYNYRSNKIEVKNDLKFVSNVIEQCIKIPNMKLIYEPNITTINGTKISSDLFFQPHSSMEYNSNQVSDKSQRYVTVSLDKIVYTTLNAATDDNILIEILQDLKFLKYKQDYPEWFNKIQILDDVKLYSNKDSLKKQKEQLLTLIDENAEKIKGNRELKSILYTNGEELVHGVFTILKEIVGSDFTHFKDEKKEDFNCLLKDSHFVGEIKGVNENVKNKNLSQLDIHVEGYRESKDIEQNKVKGLLIINPLRKTKPVDRADIHADTIDKAINKYGVLIIRTSDLLKLLELYRDRKIDKSTIIDIFAKQLGLINLSELEL